MDALPAEIILQVARFLEPREIVTLQQVCKRLLLLGRDNPLWRELCFAETSFLNLYRNREHLAAEYAQEPGFRDLAQALTNGNGGGLGESGLVGSGAKSQTLKAKADERSRILANWDPSYPDEEVNWYDEYIARNGPISTSWLEQPRDRETPQHEYLEVRGMGLYTGPGDVHSSLVVAPLDDGSVCIWDIMGARGRKGSIVARSKPGILYSNDTLPSGPGSRSKAINTGVTECVSVDNVRKVAYVAVPSGLVEVDLQTLSTVSHQHFPYPITALSEAKYPVPLTVGTNLSLHLHDPRTRASSGRSSAESEFVESYDTSFGLGESTRSPGFRGVLNPESNSPYADLDHPGPLSIVHMPSSGGEWDGNGDIYVAGRFPSILNYDRRYFPRLRGTMHSGARLCSLASLPYPFSSMDKDLARRGELSIEQVWEAKTRPGKTLIACGEYNSKGSLEMYGLSSDNLTNISSDSAAGGLQNSVMKNRQTSSSSKLLSVCTHGTRIVVSDGSGNLKWLERDGFTEVRRWNIAHGSTEAPRGMFGSSGNSFMDSGSGDIAMKLASTHTGREEPPLNGDALLMWTGEKIGLLSFSSKPGFTAESFEEKGHQTAEEVRKENEERAYSQAMRRALQVNADEVRFMRGLGHGLAGSR